MLSLMAALLLVLGTAVVTTQSALAAGALTNMSWAVSNNQAAATPTNYAYSFKTATTGTIKTITFTVSGAGLGGVGQAGDEVAEGLERGLEFGRERAGELLPREDSFRILLLGGGFGREAMVAFSRAQLRACGGSR